MTETQRDKGRDRVPRNETIKKATIGFQRKRKKTETQRDKGRDRVPRNKRRKRR